MNRKGLLLILALALLIAFASVFYFVLTSVDSIVKTAIERYGSAALETQVTVESVQISLKDGRGTLRGLHVANPPGFSGEPAVILDELTVQIEIGSIGGNPVVLPQVRVISPAVTLEINAEGESNLKRFAENLSAGGESPAPSGDAPGDVPRLAIRDFVFEQGVVHARAEQHGLQQAIQMPPLHLKDLGGSEGAPPEVIARSIARALIDASLKSAGRKGIESLIDRKIGGESGEKVKEALRKILK